MLHQMNVKLSLTNRPIRERRRMRFKRPPMLGVGPFLMCI